MMRRHHCGGRFGLFGHRHYTLQFCTAHCLEIWKRVQSDRARQYRFLEGLLQGARSVPALGGCNRYPEIVGEWRLLHR